MNPLLPISFYEPCRKSGDLLKRPKSSFSGFKSFILFSTFFSLLTLLLNIQCFSQTQLIPAADGGFENGNTFAANNWILVSASNNTWYVGSATVGAGTNASYIDKNSGIGATNLYNINIASTAHFYRDILIPTGATNISLSFLLQGSGEIGYDRLLVYTAPTSVTPVAGTPASNSTILAGATLIYTQGGFYNSFTTQSVTLPNSLAGTTIRLIFTWQNNNNTGTNAPAAVDNISLSYTPCVATPGAVPTPTCVGGSSGTITASASGGSSPYTYSLNGGAFQASTLFSGLAAGVYTLTARGSTGCTASSPVTVSPYPNSLDNQNAIATDSWIGHMYSGMNFNNYIGQFKEAETFDEGFGGDYNCFQVTSGGLPSFIYTEIFSVRFRMNSTRKGLYVVDLGSDDGSRLTVDGTLLYNNWVDQSFSLRPRILMSLTGSSVLTFDFYENMINNRVVFQNLTLILANSLSTNTTQTLCQGSAGAVISGDTYGALPAGISLTGTGYQWSYSTTPAGARTTIAGATSATFTPNTTVAPFNTAGTYYVYRNAQVTSTNNTNVNPYAASNESNAAVITVNARPTGVLSGAQAICKGEFSNIVFSGNRRRHNFRNTF